MSTQDIRALVQSLHSDEAGDIPVGPLLLIGLVVIPLVIALISFGNEITRWLKERWGDVTDNSQTVSGF